VDLGWFAVRTHPSFRVGNSGQGLESLGLEATVKVYGVAVAMPQG
jgi:hypothetical protein